MMFIAWTGLAILLALSWLGAAVSWCASWGATREYWLMRRRLDVLRKSIIEDIYDSMDEVLDEALARDDERPSPPSD